MPPPPTPDPTSSSGNRTDPEQPTELRPPPQQSLPEHPPPPPPPPPPRGIPPINDRIHRFHTYIPTEREPRASGSGSGSGSSSSSLIRISPPFRSLPPIGTPTTAPWLDAEPSRVRFRQDRRFREAMVNARLQSFRNFIGLADSTESNNIDDFLQALSFANTPSEVREIRSAIIGESDYDNDHNDDDTSGDDEEDLDYTEADYSHIDDDDNELIEEEDAIGRANFYASFRPSADHRRFNFEPPDIGERDTTITGRDFSQVLSERYLLSSARQSTSLRPPSPSTVQIATRAAAALHDAYSFNDGMNTYDNDNDNDNDDDDNYLLFPESSSDLRRQNAIHSRQANPNYDPEIGQVIIPKGKGTTGSKESPSRNNGKQDDQNWRRQIECEARILEQKISAYLRTSLPNRISSLLFPMDLSTKYSYLFAPVVDGHRSSTTNVSDLGEPIPNLEQRMDVYLKRRRLGLLWTNTVPTKSVKKRKAKTSTQKSESFKKQKVGPDTSDTTIESSQCTAAEQFHDFKSKPIDYVTSHDKDKIIDVQFSSYFQSGLRYTVTLDPEQTRGCECDIVLSNIDYTNKTIDGSFLWGNYPNIDIKCQIVNFTKFFCGINGSFYYNNYIKSHFIRRKLNILEKLLKDPQLHWPGPGPRPGAICPAPLSIPMDGDIVDFKANDLRFLSSSKPGDNVVHKHSSSSKLKSSRVRLQVLEWMKLQPLAQFKQTFLLNYLRNLRNNLLSFSINNVPKVDKSEVNYLYQAFKRNLREIQSDFYYVENELKSMVCTSSSFNMLSETDNDDDVDDDYIHEHTKFTLARQRELVNYCPTSTRKLRELEDWERTLAHRLCEQVTEDESASLLNIQLNYILFTMRVDVSKYLESCITYLLNHCESQNGYADNYKRVLERVVKEELVSKNSTRDVATLLCSINRKSGQLQIHNSLPYLHYKDVVGKIVQSTLSRVEDSIGATRIYSDFDDFPADQRATLPKSFGDLPRDFDPHRPTKSCMLSGSIKRHSSDWEVASGNPTFGIV
ncbi:uncharacterized protein RJT21DRAFT_121122 [Scheffersomyces amazonensis]|uniref:uncharacterized protein n=1 Tax=Scheffersomyces amazonensis TaxID=1078765 RepID=UPI00315DFDD7